MAKDVHETITEITNASEKGTVYETRVVCTNCNHGGTVKIARGLLVRDVECFNCGCLTLKSIR